MSIHNDRERRSKDVGISILQSWLNNSILVESFLGGLVAAPIQAARDSGRVKPSSATSASSLRANGSRECAPDQAPRSNPGAKKQELDCFVARAPRYDGVT
jgi:hypothetical protein